MRKSSNRLRRFIRHGPFAWSKKRDFLNMYDDDLLSIAPNLLLSLFLPKQAISSARRLHVFHLFFSCSFGDAIHGVFDQMWNNNMIRWETVHSKTGFPSNDWKLSKAVRGLKRISWCTRRGTLISGCVPLKRRNFKRIRGKLMGIWQLKFANFYREVYAWGQALPPVKHFCQILKV